MTCGRLLRVLPSRAGTGWDVVEPGSPVAAGHATTEAEARRQAGQLLQPGGGRLQVLDQDGFLIGSQSFPSPPGSPREPWVGSAVHLLLGTLAALALGWWFDSLVPAGVALSGCLGRLVVARRRRRVARRTRAEATHQPTGAREQSPTPERR